MDFEDNIEDTFDGKILMGTFTIRVEGWYSVAGKRSYYKVDDVIKMYDTLVEITRVK